MGTFQSKAKSLERRESEYTERQHFDGFLDLYSICLQRLPIIEKMLEKGLNINSQDRYIQFTLLHYAAYMNNIDRVEFFLKNRANPNIIPSRDRRSYEVLYDKADVGTPLDLAIRHKNAHMCKLLIDGGVNVNLCSPLSKNTPLHTALKAEQWSIAAMIIQAGADLHAMNSKLCTPLKYCTQAPKYIFEILVERGANFNKITHDNDTILHLEDFYRNKDLGVIEFLKSKGVIDIHQENKRGYTPLHVAISENHEKICRWLIEKGAKPYAISARNPKIGKPIDHATFVIKSMIESIVPPPPSTPPFTTLLESVPLLDTCTVRIGGATSIMANNPDVIRVPAPLPPSFLLPKTSRVLENVKNDPTLDDPSC